MASDHPSLVKLNVFWESQWFSEIAREFHNSKTIPAVPKRETASF